MSSRWVTPFLVMLAAWGLALTLWPSDYRTVATVHTSTSQAADSVIVRVAALQGDPDALAALLDAEPELTTRAHLEATRGDSTVLVTARHQDPRLAQAIADSVAVTVAGPRAGIEGTELSAMPTSPSGPSRLVLFGAGGALALAASTAWAARTGRGRR